MDLVGLLLIMAALACLYVLTSWADGTKLCNKVARLRSLLRERVGREV